MRALLIEMGKLDALAEFDASMKKLRLGVTGAENTWHSISAAQRRVLSLIGVHGGKFRRSPGSRAFYDLMGGSGFDAMGRVSTPNN